MKKYILILLSIFAFNTNGSFIVNINWAENHSADGGSFIMTPNTGNPFYSFCLEKNEHFYLGSDYYYTISDSTDGGLNGAPDPISIGTAWLYNNFRTGTLDGYTGTVEQQTQLQGAFWYLENEIDDINIGLNWINLAKNGLGPNVNLFDDANGLYNVGVWNLIDFNGNQAQSQLGQFAVPESTTIVSGMLLLIPLMWSLKKHIYEKKNA